MDNLLKMIWLECEARFGKACNVDIHIDRDGVSIITESKGVTQYADMLDFKINGEPLVKVDDES